MRIDQILITAQLGGMVPSNGFETVGGAGIVEWSLRIGEVIDAVAVFRREVVGAILALAVKNLLLPGLLCEIAFILFGTHEVVVVEELAVDRPHIYQN